MNSEYLFSVEEYDTAAELEQGSVNCNSGATAELKFSVAAQELGFYTYIPLCHATSVDIVILKHSKTPITIQVKKGVYQKRDDCWKVTIGTQKPSCAVSSKDYGKRYRKYQRGEFDVLAMWVKECDGFVLWTLDELVDMGICTNRWRSGEKINNWEVLENFYEPKKTAK